MTRRHVRQANEGGAAKTPAGLVVDWEEVAPEDHELVSLVARRLSTPAGPMVTMAEADRMARAHLVALARRRRHARRDG